MGDTIELSVGDDLGSTQLCYPVSASALSFQVRAERRHAQFSLLSSADRNGTQYMIIFQDISTIADRYNVLHRVRTPDIISPEEWREFWVTWHRRRLCVGRAGDPKPFLVAKLMEQPLIKFVAPNFVGGYAQSHWKLQLGPERPPRVARRVSGGELVWVAATDGVLPVGALIGGYEGEPLHIIRAAHRNSLTPGKFVPSEGVAYVPWGGQANQKEDFEALVGCNAEWVEAAGGEVPPGALLGGYAENTREMLFVGRALHEGHLVVGKVQRTHRVLYIPYQGTEVSKSEYEILVCSPKADSRTIRFDAGASQLRDGHPNCGILNQRLFLEQQAFYEAASEDEDD